MKRIAVVIAVMALLVYAGVTWGVDDETIALHADEYEFWHGGPAGVTATDGSEAGYGPDYLKDIENAMMGDLLFTSSALPLTADDVSSAAAGLTFVATHTLEAADGNDHNWVDGEVADYAWVATLTTSTLTLAYDPTNRTPTYTDGVATLTITATGAMGSTGTLVVKFAPETLLGEVVTTGTALTWNVVP